MHYNRNLGLLPALNCNTRYTWKIFEPIWTPYIIQLCFARKEYRFETERKLLVVKKKRLSILFTQGFRFSRPNFHSGMFPLRKFFFKKWILWREEKTVGLIKERSRRHKRRMEKRNSEEARLKNKYSSRDRSKYLQRFLIHVAKEHLGTLGRGNDRRGLRRLLN